MSDYMPGMHSVLQLCTILRTCLIFLCTCRVTTHASEDVKQTHAKRMSSKSSPCTWANGGCCVKRAECHYKAGCIVDCAYVGHADVTSSPVSEFLTQKALIAEKQAPRKAARQQAQPLQLDGVD